MNLLSTTPGWRAAIGALGLALAAAGCQAPDGPEGTVRVEVNLPEQAANLPPEPVARAFLYQSEHQTVSLVRVAERIRPHLHRFSEETVYLVSGQGILELAGSKRDLKAGDCVVVPRYTVHGFTPVGDEPAVLVSVFAPEFQEGDRVYFATLP